MGRIVLLLAGAGLLAGCARPSRHEQRERPVRSALAPDANEAAIVAVGTPASALVELDVYSRRDRQLAVRSEASLGMNDQWDPPLRPDAYRPRRIWIDTSPGSLLYFEPERQVWRSRGW